MITNFKYQVFLTVFENNTLRPPPYCSPHLINIIHLSTDPPLLLWLFSLSYISEEKYPPSPCYYPSSLQLVTGKYFVTIFVQPAFISLVLLKKGYRESILRQIETKTCNTSHETPPLTTQTTIDSSMNALLSYSSFMFLFTQVLIKSPLSCVTVSFFLRSKTVRLRFWITFFFRYNLKCYETK